MGRVAGRSLNGIAMRVTAAGVFAVIPLVISETGAACRAGAGSVSARVVGLCLHGALRTWSAYQKGSTSTANHNAHVHDRGEPELSGKKVPAKRSFDVTKRAPHERDALPNTQTRAESECVRPAKSKR